MKNLSAFIHLEMKEKYFNRTWTFYFLIRKVITVLTPLEIVNEELLSVI